MLQLLPAWLRPVDLPLDQISRYDFVELVAFSVIYLLGGRLFLLPVQVADLDMLVIDEVPVRLQDSRLGFLHHSQR